MLQVQDAKGFYLPVNLQRPSLPDTMRWAVSARQSLEDLSSLGPNTAPCSPDVSIHSGALGAISHAGHEGTAMYASPHQPVRESGITQALESAGPRSPAVNRSHAGGMSQQPEEPATNSVVPPAESGSLSSAEQLNGLDGQAVGTRSEPPSKAWAGADAKGEVGRQFAAHMNSATMSPQRMPARLFEEWHTCSSGSETKRSVSEPRQRMKRPPLSIQGRAHEDGDSAHRRAGRSAMESQLAQRGRRAPPRALQIDSPTHQETWHSAEPSMRHARSSSLDGIYHSSGHAASRSGVTSTSSYGDIVSPGSIFGSSPGCASVSPFWLAHVRICAPAGPGLSCQMCWLAAL